jgi:mono/diheme cytochrome c family protein
LWPQTFLRFFGGIALGAIFMTGILFFWKNWEDKEELASFRRSALRIFGVGLVVSGAIAAVCFFVYYDNIAPTFRINSLFSILTSHLAQSTWVLWAALWTSIGLVVLLAVVNLIGFRMGAAIMVIPALIGAFALTAGFERMREFIRGPYVMGSYMYASEWTAKENVLLKNAGMLNRMFWPAAAAGELNQEQQGEALFGHNCTTCHTIGGLNDIRDRVRGRSEDGIAAIIEHTHEMVPWMPPFSGSDRERMVMASYIYRLAQRQKFEPPSHLSPPQGDSRHE